MSLASDPAPRTLRDQQVAHYVARRVRELRLANLITQEELAAQLGVRRESLSRYEGGERAISIALLLDIARALGQPVSAFLPPLPGDPMTEIATILHTRPDLAASVMDLLCALTTDSTDPELL
ncbi:MAG: helix-turn-helix transcriptional regulator [Oscillochloris sp.]|nr:helix-turn-helix transcriptional regulator [Oscillochloris sp.]